MTILSASVVAFLVSVSLMVAFRPLAIAIGLVDKPGGRKTHSGEIPIVGGLAMLVGVVVAGIAGGDLGHNGMVVLTAAAFMVLIGAIDDRFDVNPFFRLFAHAAAAIALVFGTGFSVAGIGDLVGLGPIGLGWFAVPFTVLACMALINAFNMLDGLDGLAGGVAGVAFAGLAVIAFQAGASASALIAFSLVGSITAFLIFNVPARFNRPVRAFMGDAGSTLLGFVLACVALILVQPERAALPPVVVLWVMPIPIFELFTSTARRAVRGMSPMQADTGHFHHRLLEAGFSVRVIFGVYLLFSALGALIGLRAYAAGASEPVMFVSFIAFMALWLLFIRKAPAIAAALPTRFRRELENLLH